VSGSVQIGLGWLSTLMVQEIPAYHLLHGRPGDPRDSAFLKCPDANSGWAAIPLAPGSDVADPVQEVKPLRSVQSTLVAPATAMTTSAQVAWRGRCEDLLLAAE
jgi:hypothetical protein